MEGHGREEWIGDLDVSRTVGWFTTLYPVALDLAGAQDDVTALRRVKESLRQVPDRGVSYGVLRYASGDPAVRGQLGAAPVADLLFNYLGQFDQVVAGSELFRFAREPAGPWHGPTNQRTHRLEVVAAVRDGCFQARFTYGADRDRRETVEALAESFVRALRRLVEHSAGPGARAYTPSDFPLARLTEDAVDRLVAQRPDVEDVYPLSPMQRLFLSMEGGGSRIGLEQWVFRLRGPLDPSALREAWNQTLVRHSILRTAFVTERVAEPLQVVHQRAEMPWSEEDLAARDIDAILRSDGERSFDARVAPLSRVTLLHARPEEYRLVWSTHHLCVDGWSWPLVFRDVGASYAAIRDGREPALAPACQYREYIEWLAAEAPDSREFWTRELAGFTSPTPLPVDATVTGSAEQAVNEESTRLEAPATAALQEASRRLGVTLNTLVQAAWAVVLGSERAGQWCSARHSPVGPASCPASRRSSARA